MLLPSIIYSTCSRHCDNRHVKSKIIIFTFFAHSGSFENLRPFFFNCHFFRTLIYITNIELQFTYLIQIHTFHRFPHILRKAQLFAIISIYFLNWSFYTQSWQCCSIILRYIFSKNMSNSLHCLNSHISSFSAHSEQFGKIRLPFYSFFAHLISQIFLYTMPYIIVFIHNVTPQFCILFENIVILFMSNLKHHFQNPHNWTFSTHYGKLEYLGLPYFLF